MLAPPFPAASAAGPGNGHIPLALAAVGLLFLVVLFRGTAGSILQLWIDDFAYSHGFLILPIAAWLVWERRHALLAAPLRPTAWALLPLCAFAGVWLAAQVVSIQVVSQFALVALANCLLLALLGPAGFRTLLFPALFLFTAIPVGQGLTPELQAWTANIAAAALRATGMPVFQEGLQLATPIGNFAVADECSGLRFLTATLTLAILVSAQFYTSWRRRIAFLALALVIPILANGLRVYTIILLARTFGLEFAASVDHVVYGWIFLSLVTGLLLMVGWSFRQPPAPLQGPAAAGAGPRDRGSARRNIPIAAAALVILGGTALAAGTLARAPGPIAGLDLPSTSSALDETAIRALPWHPVLPGADARRFDQEMTGGRSVTRAVAYFAWQRQGAKAANDAASFAPEDWTRLSFGKADVTVDGQSFAPQRLVVANGTQRWLIYAWYWVDDRFTGDPVASKLLQIEGLLRGRNAAATIVFATPFAADEDPTAAEQALARTLQQQQGLSSALAHAGGF